MTIKTNPDIWAAMNDEDEDEVETSKSNPLVLVGNRSIPLMVNGKIIEVPTLGGYTQLENKVRKLEDDLKRQERMIRNLTQKLHIANSNNKLNNRSINDLKNDMENTVKRRSDGE